jgi:hypothetical protein
MSEDPKQISSEQESIPHPFDAVEEHVLTFTELARRIPRRRNNRPTHVSTLHRWRQVGIRGVRLSATKHGGIWMTSLEAYQRFTQEVSTKCSPASVPHRGNSDKANIVKTDRKLAAIGL